MRAIWTFFILICLASVFCSARSNKGDARTRRRSTNSISTCESLANFNELRKKIKSYQGDVNKIIDLVENGPEKGKTWEELALFCDTFGPRMSGSKSLEDAIAYMKQKMLDSKLNVTAEPAMIPKWEVYEQWAEMSEPRKHKMSILTLGSSVATNGTLEREIVLVHDFQELDRLGERVRDKIVLYNYKFIDYPTSVAYRTEGALRASKYGAAAALVRSVTPFSINSPHTGMSTPSIPTAAITIEDADLIERIIKRGKVVRVKLHLQTKHFKDVQSFNLVGDITGSSSPEEVVLVSGHIDSWYNTDGAMDDGGGMMIAHRALEVLRKLNLQAARTMRSVLWTSEEFGLIGAKQYFENHKHELSNFKAVIESDEGTFVPLGLGYKNVGQLGQCVLSTLLEMLAPRIGTDKVSTRFEGSDIEYFTDAQVPGLSLLNENHGYFYFHHTAGDSMTVEDPQSLDRATVLFASTVYVLAQLDVDLRS